MIVVRHHAVIPAINFALGDDFAEQMDELPVVAVVEKDSLAPVSA